MPPTRHPRPPALLLAASTLAIASAPAQNPPPQATHPDWKLLRQNEDWTRPPANDGDPLDAIKHVDLTDDGAFWVSFGGRVDERFEAWDGFGFGARTPGDRDSFFLTRVHLHADLHLGPNVRVWVEPRTAQSTDRDLPGQRRVVDVDTFDLYQAFVDLSAPVDGKPLRLRVGRQSFVFGAQRVISPVPWNNVWNSWDGASAQWEIAGFRTQALFTWSVPNEPTSWNELDEDRQLYGVYATKDATTETRGLDLYALGTTRPRVTVNGTSGDERRHTFGARSFGPLGDGFDGELEAAWQLGRLGGSGTHGGFAAGVLGYRADSLWLTPRFFVGGDVATGDARPGGSVGTYFQNSPLGHAYLGYIDSIGRQNVVAAHLGSSWSLTAVTTLTVTGHVFRLFSGNDDLYAVNGGSTSPGIAPDGRDVGQEIDVLLTHRIARHLDVYGGWSHFFTGSAVQGPGVTGSDIDFAYCGASFVF
jgi:hypothetical protein